jgi:hypothetical protein
VYNQLEIDLFTKSKPLLDLDEESEEFKLNRLKDRIEDLRTKLNELEQRRLDELRTRPRSLPLIGPTVRLVRGSGQPGPQEPPPQLPGV